MINCKCILLHLQINKFPSARRCLFFAFGGEILDLTAGQRISLSTASVPSPPHCVLLYKYLGQFAGDTSDHLPSTSTKV